MFLKCYKNNFLQHRFKILTTKRIRLGTSTGFSMVDLISIDLHGFLIVFLDAWLTRTDVSTLHSQSGHNFLSVYGTLLSCTYIIEAIYNNGVIKDSFQFIKKANTERIMEETKWWEIERTKWKRKKRDWRLLVVKQSSKRIYLFVVLRTLKKTQTAVRVAVK